MPTKEAIKKATQLMLDLSHITSYPIEEQEAVLQEVFDLIVDGIMAREGETSDS